MNAESREAVITAVLSDDTLMNEIMQIVLSKCSKSRNVNDINKAVDNTLAQIDLNSMVKELYDEITSSKKQYSSTPTPLSSSSPSPSSSSKNLYTTNNYDNDLPTSEYETKIHTSFLEISSPDSKSNSPDKDTKKPTFSDTEPLKLEKRRKNLELEQNPF